jgi:hypothetical protein
MEAFDRVGERALGGFAGWAGPNDFISDFRDPYFSSLDRSQDHRRSLMGCCSGSGSKGLYLAWHHAAEDDGEALRVNFAVSRECASASIRVFEPAEGRVEVRLKADRSLKVRVPGGVKHDEVRVTCDGRPTTPRWEGEFACLAGLKARPQVTVLYPLVERTETVTVGAWDFTKAVDYKVAWRGNTVVGIDPPGRRCPLYRRTEAIAEGTKVSSSDLPCPANEFEY